MTTNLTVKPACYSFIFRALSLKKNEKPELINVLPCKDNAVSVVKLNVCCNSWQNPINHIVETNQSWRLWFCDYSKTSALKICVLF